MYIDIEEVLWRKIEKQPTRWNEISVNFRGKVGHYRNGSLCYCFSLVGQHLYISYEGLPYAVAPRTHVFADKDGL